MALFVTGRERKNLSIYLDHLLFLLHWSQSDQNALPAWFYSEMYSPDLNTVLQVKHKIV